MTLSIAYFPPVEYFALLARYSSVYMDGSERYQKQSYRNRCSILTANGPMDLSFPIIHNGHYGIREVLVDYSTDWIRKTEYAIDSAYYNSPFFEYYRDELFSLLDAEPALLWDLDMGIIDFFCRKTGISPKIVISDGAESVEDDFRALIHPKKVPVFKNTPYWQVFREKFGFVPNLSIMDLLFNEGPESICYLRNNY